MPAFFNGLAWFLGVYTTRLVWRVLASMGVGVATYAGLNFALDQIEVQIAAAYGSMTQTMIDAITLLKLDQGMSIILSAYAAVAFIAGSRLFLTKLNGG